MSERKEGWYWIKVHGSDEWECAHWQNEGWWLAGDDMHVGNTMAAVGPRIPTPDEPWQCVPMHEPTEEMLFKAETEAKRKEVDIYSPTPTEHPDDGGGVAGYYYRGLLSAAPKPEAP